MEPHQNGFRKNRSRFSIRWMFVAIAIFSIIFLMNKDVSDRSSRFLVARTAGWIESPSFLDCIFFRRHVVITDSVDSNSQIIYRINLFGIDPVYGRKSLPMQKTILGLPKSVINPPSLTEKKAELSEGLTPQIKQQFSYPN